MNKRNIITLAVLFTIATFLLIVSQNTSAKVMTEGDAIGIWGYVKEWSGTPTSNTCEVTTVIDYGNFIRVIRVNVGNFPEKGPGAYLLTPLAGDPAFPLNSHQQVVANNGGRVGYVTFDYTGDHRKAPDIKLSKVSIY